MIYLDSLLLLMISILLKIYYIHICLDMFGHRQRNMERHINISKWQSYDKEQGKSPRVADAFYIRAKNMPVLAKYTGEDISRTYAMPETCS